MRGRKPAGPERTRRLPGDQQAKARAEIILEVLTGQRSVQEASALLGITPQHFDTLAKRFLQGGLVALVPKRGGRPRRRPTAEQERIHVLEQENQHLRRQLEAHGLVDDIALLLPRRPQRGEKKRPSADRPAPGGPGP
jgi:hypothetical protein